MATGTEGEVRFSLTFSRDDQSRTLIIGEASTAIKLECQVCLNEFLEEISCEIDTVVVDALDELFQLDQGRAAFVASGRLISLQDILEDELIVSVPMVPKHRAGCGRYAPEVFENTEPKDRLAMTGFEDTHRPFSDLAQKFKKVR